MTVQNLALTWDPAVTAPYVVTGLVTANPASSEGGKLVTGADPLSSVVQTGGGKIWGTQTGDEGAGGVFNDSQIFYAGGFSSNHRVEFTINFSGTPVGDLEIECLLGFRVGSLHTAHFGPTHSDGIEVNLTVGEFGILCFVAHWLEIEIGDFSAAAVSHGIADGDIFCAQLTLNSGAGTGTVKVSMIRAGVETVLGTITDAALFQTGQPGWAFYRGNNGTPDDPKLFCAKRIKMFSI